MKHKLVACILLSLCLLVGCAEKGGTSAISEPLNTPEATVGSELLEESAVPAASHEPKKVEHPLEIPPFAGSEFHETEAVNGVKLDLSSTADGYVAVAATSDARLKFQVLMGEATYTYNMASDGTPSIFPLQSGDGVYTFRVMENVEGTKYAVKYTTEAQVTLTDEFQPFLRPSDYANYSEDSLCVIKAGELATQCETKLELVGAIFDFICNGVIYDKEKAASLPSDYLPDPDETMTTGEGICFDYASLAAAMLRSQGIPTRIIFGYVEPNDLYHAWNMFYTDETGWVTVDYEVSMDSWNRLDLTFSANGADENFIGNGTNYTDVYVY